MGHALEWAALPGRLGLTAQQGTYFGLTESPVPSGRTDAADPAGGRPPGNRLRVNSEEGCDLSRSEKALIVAIHARFPSRSQFGTPVPSVATNTCFGPRFRKTRLQQPAPGSAAPCPAGICGR